VRKRYKQYELDETVPVPKRTKFRRKKELSGDSGMCSVSYESEKVMTALSEITNEENIECDYTEQVNSNMCNPFHNELVTSECVSTDQLCSNVYTEQTNACISSEIMNDTDELIKQNSDASVTEKCMAILAFATKMKLTSCGTDQLMKLIKLFSNGDSLQDLNGVSLKNIFDGIDIREHRYCQTCNLSDVECRCTDMQKISHFATAPIVNQLKEILMRPGMSDCLEDISVIKLMMNTDGVPLYSSSSVSLWPVYLVINNLPSHIKFRKENMIIWGLWQGRGKPNFHTYFSPLVAELNNLWTNGIHVFQEEQIINVKLTIATMDLQAKAYVMAMNQHNGEYGCVSCEHSGSVCKQGKGYARGYSPSFQHPPPTRTTESVLSNAQEVIASQTRKPVKGIKGVSVLFEIDYLDPVDAVVPDYMHGVLLGTTKKLLSLWFNKEHSKKAYYLGKNMRDINNRLMAMKPTDALSRLPRKVETVTHWKASELENWLLFYAVPCLKGILPEQYFHNLCCLIGGIYILLTENPSDEELDRAEKQLKDFYVSFEIHYGTSNCGMNVHNIGCHLVDYVRQHGPMWGWSCFPFEDMNGLLVRSAHGTGQVCKQLLRYLLTHKKLHAEANFMQSDSLKKFTKDMLTVGKRSGNYQEAANCRIMGKTFPGEIPREIKEAIAANIDLNVDDCLFLKARRVHVNDNTVHSIEYKRVQKRICYGVLIQTDQEHILSTVQYFVHESKSDRCYAVVSPMEILSAISENVPHIVSVEESERRLCYPVENISEKVMFMQGNTDHLCMARLPNLYKHTM
jgi:hypothetical protein